MPSAKLRSIVAIAGLGAGLVSGVALAADVKGSADHPLVSRYEGAAIVQYSQEKFDEYTLLLGKPKGREPGDHPPQVRLVIRMYPFKPFVGIGAHFIFPVSKHLFPAD